LVNPVLEFVDIRDFVDAVVNKVLHDTLEEEETVLDVAITRTTHDDQLSSVKDV
jgi:hypothetical protein